MSDVVVTTPKSRMAEAATEAAAVRRAGGGSYFRRFSTLPAGLRPGDSVFYVEDGYVRGFAVVSRLEVASSVTCETTGRRYGSGEYAIMDARSWRWIRPIPMRWFQGWRHRSFEFEEIGGWLDPKPPVDVLAQADLFGMFGATETEAD